MILFPIYVCDDAGDVTAYSSFEQMQDYMEAIDVENNEYEAWDADGNVLELSVSEPKSQWLKIKQSDLKLAQAKFAEIKTKAIPYRNPVPLFKSL